MMPNPGPIFYEWANNVVDITPDNTATDEFLILLAIDNLPKGNPEARLADLRSCFADLASGRYSDQQLLTLWRSTNARAYPRRSTEFFRTAVVVIDDYVRTDGKNARDMWERHYGST